MFYGDWYPKPEVNDTVVWKDNTTIIDNNYYFVSEKTSDWNGYVHEDRYKLIPWDSSDTPIWVSESDWNLFEKIYDRWNTLCDHPVSARSYIGIGPGGYEVCVLCDTKLS